MKNYDIIVIGGGPGGYVCSIKAAQLGKRVLCVEGKGKLGGTCLNVGCIPSKALLHASELYHETKKNFSQMGIIANETSIDWDKMLSYKNKMISQNTQGIEYLFKKNNVDYKVGWASFVSKNIIKVEEEEFEGENIVIATGSVPSNFSNIKIDQKKIVDSTGALEMEKIPETMIIVGGGIIGLEMATIFSRLKTKVTIIEYLDHIATGMDLEVSKEFHKIMRRQKIKFHLNSSVKKITSSEEMPKVQFQISGSDDLNELEAEAVLIATGRKPFTNNLCLESVGIECNEKGQIKVNESLQTIVENIYAIGDVIEGPMLAHKAEDEGIAVAERICGQKGHVNYNLIPSVIYTSPEVSSVGKTEEQLKKENISYKIGKFPFMGNGRAKVHFSSDGFVKLLTEEKTNKILGAHIIGPSAGDLIHEICVAMEFGANAEDLARTCHAHPTVSEAVREAALECCDGAIHF